MFKFKYFDEATVNVNDTVSGVVTCSCLGGIYIDLDNGQKAFSRFASLPQGTRVLCTVKYLATDQKRMLVEIDSYRTDYIAA